jgi:hypothetical protein
MVGKPLALALSLLASAPLTAGELGLSATATAQSVSQSSGALPPLPAAPEKPAYQPNVPWEDFTAVTLISLPFTALWSVLGAVAAASISQKQFPPSMGTPQLAGAAMVAASASVSIGLVSIQWGGPKPTPTPEAR